MQQESQFMKNCLTKQKQKDIIELQKKIKHISKELKNALNCGGEVDLPLLGESLLRKWEEIAAYHKLSDVFLEDLKERLEKIKNCDIDPDYNIEMASFISQKMLREVRSKNA